MQKISILQVCGGNYEYTYTESVIAIADAEKAIQLANDMNAFMDMLQEEYNKSRDRSALDQFKPLYPLAGYLAEDVEEFWEGLDLSEHMPSYGVLTLPVQ